MLKTKLFFGVSVIINFLLFSGLEAFKRRDPKLEKFRRTPSTGNVTEEILNGVVTDNEHHGVKDLVAMIEKNTK